MADTWEEPRIYRLENTGGTVQEELLSVGAPAITVPLCFSGVAGLSFFVCGDIPAPVLCQAPVSAWRAAGGWADVGDMSSGNRSLQGHQEGTLQGGFLWSWRETLPGGQVWCDLG